MVVLIIGKISGGWVLNVIVDWVEMLGIVRLFYLDIYKILFGWIENIVVNVCNFYGVKYELNYW